MTEPLTCRRCGSRVAICERVEGFIDWGPAVITGDGTVRPELPVLPSPVMADNSTAKGAYAVCDNTQCGHRWTLRRRFDPTLPADGEQTGGGDE